MGIAIEKIGFLIYQVTNVLQKVIKKQIPNVFSWPETSRNKKGYIFT